jgi:exodeoxyribonuclease V alpha subunit
VPMRSTTGTEGGIRRKVPDVHEVMVLTDGRSLSNAYSDPDELLSVYALSVNKSQGSECPCVVIPLLSLHYVMLQGNLICTAIKRGKKLTILIGSKKALAFAVKNDKTQKRHTQLKVRLAPG